MFFAILIILYILTLFILGKNRKKVFLLTTLCIFLGLTSGCEQINNMKRQKLEEQKKKEEIEKELKNEAARKRKAEIEKKRQEETERIEKIRKEKKRERIERAKILNEFNYDPEKDVPGEVLTAMLQEVSGDKIKYTFNKDTNTITLTLQNEFKNIYSLMLKNKAHPNFKQFWKTEVDSLVLLSKQIKNTTSGITLVLLHPDDESKEILKVLDGIIKYDFMNDDLI